MSVAVCFRTVKVRCRSSSNAKLCQPCCPQGIAIPNRAPEITEVIKALMAKLEADKPRANLNPPEDAAYCENFACTIFERADKVDRAGRGDKNTAMTFYAASVFIEVRLGGQQ